ncbi:hypothetical protein HPP92_021199 [Vanilla planifolia]|uniref:protein-serine/threonine phosphatase n=1 Tax=Vanilla planifolia TaxID=51239 RepID=A0A835Q3S5_VANPL|nr:hypothetical protein HPP92_021199 [Vanilla planifolia]
MKIISPCWKLTTGVRTEESFSRAARSDGLLWYKDLGRHAAGEFSMAVVQATNQLEDGSQIEAGPLCSDVRPNSPFGTFVGVYDGHGGPETARYITEHLFQDLKKVVSDEQEISADVIKNAFAATEEGFLSLVRKQWTIKPQLASVGSCCLMTSDHNASNESVRDELRLLHPHDSQIVVMKHKVWRVKGVIQVSRSIGDAYLKDAEFNRDPLLANLPKDLFVIFASDGLWEHLGNQEAAEIVHMYPRSGIARRLIKAAVKEAAKKREMRYSDLKKIDRGIRRHFHDDISVVVVYFDPIQMSKNSYLGPVLSLKGGVLP